MTMTDWLIPAIVAVVVALFANGAGWFLWRARRAKIDVDAAEVLTGAALEMVQRWEKRVIALETSRNEMEEEIKQLKARVRVLEDENHILRTGAGRLEGQVVSLGHTPVWRLSHLDK